MRVVTTGSSCRRRPEDQHIVLVNRKEVRKALGRPQTGA